MLWYLIVGAVCCITTTLALYPIHRMIVRWRIQEHDDLVKPIADAAFLEGFDKGWESAVSDPTVVKDTYIRMFMNEY